MKRNTHKLLSGVLTAALLLQAVMPVAVFAAEGAPKIIAGISALEQTEYTLPIGAEQAVIDATLTFPKTITAEVEYFVTEEVPPVQDSGKPETPPEQPVEKKVTEKVELSVTWESEQKLTTEKAGAFTYTAVLSDKGKYALAGGVSLPEITVTVGAPMLMSLREGNTVLVDTPEKFRAAFADAVDGDIIRVTASTIDLGAYGVTVPNDKTVTLDLCGKTVTYSGISATISLSKGASLEVLDSSNNKQGELKSTNGGEAIYTDGSNTKVTVSGGTVSAIRAAAIRNSSSNGSVNVSGGTVSSTGGIGTITNPRGGTLNISGGTVSATTGSAIENNGGTVNISGGTVLATTGYAIQSSSIVVKVTKGLILGDCTGAGTDGLAWSCTGEMALPFDVEIPSGKTFTVKDGATLTIPRGVTLTNNGIIAANGKLNYGAPTYGEISGGGTIQKNATNSVITLWHDGTKVDTAELNVEHTLRVTIDKPSFLMFTLFEEQDKANFYLGTDNTGTKIGDTVTFKDDPADSDKLIAEVAWTPDISSVAPTQSIFVEYGKLAAGGNHFVSPGTASVTVPVRGPDFDLTTGDHSGATLDHDGYTWNAETNTLTLKDLKINGDVIVPNDTPVTVILQGTTVVWGSFSTKAGYHGDLSFENPGNLTVGDGINLGGSFGDSLTVGKGAVVTGNRSGFGASGGNGSTLTVDGTDSKLTLSRFYGQTLNVTNGATLSVVPGTSDLPDAGILTMPYGGTLNLDTVSTIKAHGVREDPSGSNEFTNVLDSIKPYLPKDYSIGKHDNYKTVLDEQGLPATDILLTSRYTLTFNTNGGSAIENVTKPANTSIALSDRKPTKSGYTFAGWYSDMTLATPVDSVTLTRDTTVYAKWTKDTPTDPGDKKYTLTFNTNGGSSIETVTGPANTSVALSAYKPTKSGYTFAGWYSDAALTASVDSVMLTGNITIYAKWTKDSSPGSSNGSDNAGRETPVISNSSKVIIDALVKAGAKETTVKSGVVAVTLNLETLKEIQKQAGSDVTVTATKVANATLSAEAKALVGNRPVYDLSITGKNGTKVTSFGKGTVSVSIPYTLGANETAGNVVAYYIDSTGKAQEMANSVYNPDTKSMGFVTSHFSMYAVGYQTSPAFADTAKHPAKSSIEFVAARGLLSGTGGGKFSPDSAITRGSLQAALEKLSGRSMSAVVGGNAQAAVTRQELAVIMQNYAKGVGFALPKVHAENTFADNAKIGAYAKDAVKTMQMAGVLAGKNGNQFDPQGTATRAEVSAVLQRFVELAISTDSAQGWMRNDSGKWMFYENGRPVTGTKTIGGVSYTFDKNGETADLPKKRA